MDEPVRLEDEFGDVIGKARRGQEIPPAELAARAGLELQQLEQAERYTYVPPEGVVRALASLLGLDPDNLWASATGTYAPTPPAAPAAIRVVRLALGDEFRVNSYLVICRGSGAAVLVDPGAEPQRILAAVARTRCRPELVLVTHGHHDHVGALGAVQAALQVPALAPPADLPLLGTMAASATGRLVAGQAVRFGDQQLTVAHIPGHTPGAVALLHDEAAFVGDVLFAGSVGGTRRRTDYLTQLHGVAEHLLSLPGPVGLYPGHGPPTCVAAERQHNPFFPAR